MRGSIAFGGLCLIAASMTAGEGRVVFTAPARGQAFAAGTAVEVSWAGVPENVEEVELLLSLDGGGRIALRLTEQFSPDTRSILWRVPNLASRQAAFVLRMGIEGREIESAPSAPFEIVPEPLRPVEPVDWRAGELWLGQEAATRDAGPMPAAGLDSRPERWIPLLERDDSIESEGVALSGDRPTPRRPRVTRDPSFEAPRGFLARAPLLGSLRI
jgi:hypothetical protein